MYKILATAALIFFLTACSGGNESGSNTGGSASGMTRFESGPGSIADNLSKPEQPNNCLPETVPKPEKLKRNRPPYP